MFTTNGKRQTKQSRTGIKLLKHSWAQFNDLWRSSDLIDGSILHPLHVFGL